MFCLIILLIILPHPERIWDVFLGSTNSTRLPVHSAFKVVIVINLLQAASAPFFSRAAYLYREVDSSNLNPVGVKISSFDLYRFWKAHRLTVLSIYKNQELSLNTPSPLKGTIETLDQTPIPQKCLYKLYKWPAKNRGL